MTNSNPPLLDSIIDDITKRIVAGVSDQLRRDGSSPSVSPRLMNVADAAVYLGRTKQAVQHMVQQRRIPFVRDGHRVFLDVNQLDRWILDNTEHCQN